MIISNFVLCFCATAVIFLSNADAIGLDVGGIVDVQIGEKTHPFKKLLCKSDAGSANRQCRFQVNEQAFARGRIYYKSGTKYCEHTIVCDYNGQLIELKNNRRPPDGTPCDDYEPTWACYKGKCLPAADEGKVENCYSSEAIETSG